MKRRKFLHEVSAQTLAAASALSALGGGVQWAADRLDEWIDPATARHWQARWEKSILDNSDAHRYCDTERSEGLGWRVSPFLNGFYYGYLVTHSSKWVKRFVDWTDSCIKRAVKEPDGFLGWPELAERVARF